MIKNSKFVKTAIAAAALGLMAFSAQATINATQAAQANVIFAQELFQGSVPGTAVTIPTFSVFAPVAIPQGSTITVIVKLSGATFLTVAAPTSPNAGGVVALVGAAAGRFNSNSATAVTGTGVVDATANADSIAFTITNTGAAIGLGIELARFTNAAISAPGLATSGASVTATSAIYQNVMAATPVFGVAITNTVVEAPSAAATVATSSKLVVLNALAAATSQTIVIPAQTSLTVGAAPTGSGAATTYRIGTLQIPSFATAAVAPQDATGAAAMAVPTSVVTVSAPAGYFAALAAPAGGGAAGGINLFPRAAVGAAACQGVALPVVLSGTPATATTATSAAIAVAASTAALAYDVCVTTGTGGTSGNAATLKTTTPTIGVVTGVTAAQFGSTALATTNLTALALNGSSVTANYWPASFGPAYAGFIRVTNTGTVAAPVSVAYINPTTGVASSAFPLGVTLAAGASTMLSSATIEAAMTGVAVVGAAGRVIVSAPTTALSVQTFVQTNGAAPQETSGGVNSSI